jgi:hypothetical protein
MPTLRRNRWALIVIALAVGTCILFAALASPFGHIKALAPLPVFLFEIAVLVIAYRRANQRPHLYVQDPFFSDITQRGPPTF